MNHSFRSGLEGLAGTTRLELATSAVTISEEAPEASNAVRPSPSFLSRFTSCRSSGYSRIGNVVSRRRRCEQRYKALDQCGVRQDRITQRGVGQPCDHRNLDGAQDFPRTDTEGREPKDAIAISLHESLQKAARFGKCAGTQVGFHCDLKQAIRYALSLRFCFTQTDTSKFGVGKQTIWDLPARGHTVAAG